ncbi:glycoside hydrolase family 19 protein [Pseudomonas sp. UMAB-40]|uniref:glycoside hydrolase family 19 protein n=1 Tax=Pseudomonas sp. UMAB-40 TaxID=1365407 RepID=UPI001C58C56E|nr:glycoside hydrolase family 19 protein [Pseudomonas sp. UMAB-40]
MDIRVPSGPDGFLTGKASESLDRIASEIAVLKAIHADTSATLKQLTSIARSLSGPAPAAPPNQRLPEQRTPASVPRAPVAPRDPSSRPAGSPSTAPRDGGGRFLSKPSAPDAGPPRSSEGGRVSAAIGGAGESLRGAGHSIAAGADGIDPTVQAAKELGGILSPLGAVFKPMGRLFGRSKTPEQKNQRENVTWYRRIWSAVKNPASGGGGGMGLMMTALLSMLGMLLSPIKALGRLLGMGSLGGLLKGVMGGGRGGRGRNRSGTSSSVGADGKKRPGRAGGGSGGLGASTKAEAAAAKAARGGGKGILGKGLDFGKSLIGKGAGLLGKSAKGFIRKIPFVGTLLGGLMVANAVLADEDPNATPDEKKQAKADKWGTVGGVAGGVVGGALGSFLGPVGTIAGGIAGDYIGSALGEWLSTVDFDAVATTISDTFTTLADSTLDLATSAFDSIKGAWSGLVESAAKIFTSMSDWAKDTWKAATDAVLGLKDTVADKVQSAQDYVGEKVTNVKDAGQNLIAKATGGRYTGGSDARKDELIKAMDTGGITDQKSKAMLMANVDVETGGFKKNEENLNYSAKRLQEIFPKYYSTPESARADAGNPEAIANKVYGGRMGNTEAGDGYKYRGRGDIQLTGKAQYADMSKKLGVDLVNNPDLAMDPKYSAQIAVQHWKSSGADKAAMAGDVDRARKLTNGGTNGLAEVKGKYGGYLTQAQAGDLTPTRRADQGKVQAPDAANAALASTMSVVKGVPAVGVMPVGPRPSVAPVLPSGQTVGVMAASVPVPAMGMASVKPISAGSMMAPSYSPPAADASMMRLAPTPAVEKPIMAPGKAAPPASIQLSVPLTQNLEDRQIAHVASGGVGM